MLTFMRMHPFGIAHIYVMYSQFRLVLARLCECIPMGYLKNAFHRRAFSSKISKCSKRIFLKQLPIITKSCFGKVAPEWEKSFILEKYTEMLGYSGPVTGT